MNLWKESSKTTILATKELKRERIRLGYTVRQFAHSCGVSPTMIWNVESGLKPVPAKLAAKITKVIEAAQAKTIQKKVKKHHLDDNDDSDCD